jgi:hypothetical protein
LLALVRAKRYWWKKHLGDKENELIKVEYKLSLNRVTSAKKVKRINLFSRKFDLGDGSPPQVWNGIKLAIHDGVASERKEVNLIGDGRLFLDRKEISEPDLD